MTPNELRAFLKRHNMSPKGFALIIGVTHMAVVHWLDDSRAISLTVVRLTKLFDKHPELIVKFMDTADV